MSNFNDKIKALLAFSASFEEFKSDIEGKLNKLNKPVDLSGLVKKDDLNQSIDILSEELKKAKLDAFAFDSARRTFGEEIGVLKSFIDKEIAKIQSTIVKPKSYDAEIKELKLLIEKLPAQKDYTKGIESVKQLIKPAKSYDAEIKALRLLIENLPTAKNYDAEIKGVYEKLETVKHIDYSKDIEAVKKLIPKQIDNSKDVQDLASQFKTALLEVNSKLSELANLSKKVDDNAFIADSARRTFGDEIGVLRSYIDKEFSKLKGDNNG